MRILFKISCLALLAVGLVTCKKDKIETVTDASGNVYHTVKIGTQVWLLENLKTTKYNNGDEIPNITDQTIWKATTAGAYCEYLNTPENAEIYGHLYNWYTVNDNRGIAPSGFRVATIEDWNTLIDYLGGEAVAGKKLKATGELAWTSYNTGDNSSGFSALGAGGRTIDVFFGLMSLNVFWSNSSVDQTHANTIGMVSDQDVIYKQSQSKLSGFSVRCVKDVN